MTTERSTRSDQWRQTLPPRDHFDTPYDWSADYGPQELRELEEKREREDDAWGTDSPDER